MPQKTIAELEAEIKKEEDKLYEAYKERKNQEEVQRLRKKLVRLKYQKQLDTVNNAIQKGKLGLVSAAKLVNRALNSVQAYNQKLEAKERKAARAAARGSTTSKKASAKSKHTKSTRRK